MSSLGIAGAQSGYRTSFVALGLLRYIYIYTPPLYYNILFLLFQYIAAFGFSRSLLAIVSGLVVALWATVKIGATEILS